MFLRLDQLLKRPEDATVIQPSRTAGYRVHRLKKRAPHSNPNPLSVRDPMGQMQKELMKILAQKQEEKWTPVLVEWKEEQRRERGTHRTPQ